MIKSISDIKLLLLNTIKSNKTLQNITVPCLVKKISTYSFMIYLDIVDPKNESIVIKAQISTKIYNNDIENDSNLVITGHMLYNKDLVFQITSYEKVEKIKSKYEKIYEKLKKENSSREKKRIPKCQNIGIISSSNASGLKDFLDVVTTLHLKNIYIFNITLQGPYMERQMLNALNIASTYDIDILCIIRGGGARTDLEWFDNYNIAKALISFPIYTISGIGHETDHTITDLVTDKSLNTPTQVSYFIKSLTYEPIQTINYLLRSIETHITNTITTYNQVSLLIDNYHLQNNNKEEKLLEKVNVMIDNIVENNIIDTFLEKYSVNFIKEFDNYQSNISLCLFNIDRIIENTLIKIDQTLNKQQITLFNKSRKHIIITKDDFIISKQRKDEIVIQFLDGEIIL